MTNRFPLVFTAIAVCALTACATRSSDRTPSGSNYDDATAAGSQSTIEVYRSENNLVSSTGTSDTYTVTETTRLESNSTTTIPSNTERSSTTDNRDAEILALLVAVDDFEVRVATEAEKKQLRDEVRDFAKTMRTEHARHADDTRALAGKLGLSLADTQSVTAQRQDGDREFASLGTLEGDSFDRAYVDAMVKGHQDLLAKLDGFLATTQRDEIRTHVQKTRDAVAGHLEHAKKLQNGSR